MGEESIIGEVGWGAPEGWISTPVWPRVLTDGRRLVHGVLPIEAEEPKGKTPLAEALGVHGQALEGAFGGAAAGDEKIVFVGGNQVHGENIEIVNEATHFTGSIAIPGMDDGFSLVEFRETDALIAKRTNVVLVIQTADCLPILFNDPVTGMIGACHCGWRGLIAGLAGKTAARMIELGANADTLEVWIGPGIGVASYEVGAELVGRFEKAFPDALSSPEGTHLDLARVAESDLRGAGLSEQHITNSEVCTYAHPARLHSYRRDGEAAGRLLTVIGILELK